MSRKKGWQWKCRNYLDKHTESASDVYDGDWRKMQRIVDIQAGSASAANDSKKLQWLLYMPSTPAVF